MLPILKKRSQKTEEEETVQDAFWGQRYFTGQPHHKGRDLWSDTPHEHRHENP